MQSINGKFEIKLWGGYQVLVTTDQSVTKLMSVKPHTCTSLQEHTNRDEMWSMVEGELYVETEDRNVTMEVGDNVIILAGEKHRFSNYTDETVYFIEVQTGECKEDDIIRYIPSMNWSE